MTAQSIDVAGMTCAACETTVAEAALTIPGVDRAKASSKSGKLTITGKDLPTAPVIERVLAERLAGTPYSLGERPLLTRERGVWTDVLTATVAVALIAAIAVVTNLDAGISDLTARATTGSALFVLGLGVAASVSTCMALVGGLVVSLAATVPGGGAARGWARARPHALFNLGRIVGFGALGALVGLAGQSLSLHGRTLGLTLAVVAVVMGLLGLRLTGISPRLAAWQVSLPSSWGTWARRDSSSATPSNTWRDDARAAALGAATFFLPCGFTQAVQVYALSTGSPVQGGLILALFAVGTTPGLMAAGWAASAAKGRGAVRALRYVGVAVVAFALVTAVSAVTTALPGLLTTSVVAAERTANVHDEAGWQIVATDVVWDGYSPASAVVYLNEPVRWVLTPESFGCAALIEAQGLGISERIAVLGEEDVIVEFTPTELGTFSYNCAMGMYSGSFTVIDRPAAAA